MKYWKKCFLCSTKYNTAVTYFFGVPKCPIKRKRWETSCGVDLPPRSLLCDKHFSSTDYINAPGNPGKNRLLPSAVPVVYTPADSLVPISQSRQKLAGTAANHYTLENVQEVGQWNIKIKDSHVIPASISEIAPSQLKNTAIYSTKTIAHGYEKGFQQESDIKASAISSLNTKVIPTQSEYIELINEELFDENSFSEKEEMNRCSYGSEPVGVSCQNLEDLSNADKCGFVTMTKGVERNYYLSCFYCSTAFAIYKWKEFCAHVTETHSKLETQFSLNVETNNMELNTIQNFVQEQVSSYDMQLKISISDSANLKAATNETISNQEVVKISTLSCNNENVDEENFTEESYLFSDCNNKNKEQNHGQMSISENCSHHGNNKSGKQIGCDQIRFGKTNPDIVINFLQRLKEFPCLWYTNINCVERYEDALDVLLNKMNKRWGLKLSKTELRKDLECIKRYYNSVLENRRQYDNYYPKFDEYLKICAEIPYDGGAGKCNQASTKPPKASLLPRRIRRKFICTREKCHKCPVCEKEFFMESSFKIHVQLHSGEIRPFRCDICNRHYLTENKLRQHKKRHDPPKYVCSICSKRYAYEFNFEMHMKSHTDAFDYVCEWCGQPFVDKKPYLTHVRSKHKSEGHCNICNQSCQTFAALDRHLKACHRPLIISEDFKRAFTNQAIVKQSDNGAHSKGVKKPRKYNRRYHSIIDPDTGLRRVCCPNCDKNYKAYDTLYSHIIKIHGYEPIKESFVPNKVRKPNPSHFKRKYPEGTVRRKHKTRKSTRLTKIKEDNGSSTETKRNEFSTVSGVISKESLSVNNPISFGNDAANYQNIEAQFSLTTDTDVHIYFET